MKFTVWWKYRNLADKRAMAERIGCSYSTLRQAGQGHYRVSPKLARKISRYTGNDVTLHDLRPDIYSPDQR